MKSLLLFVWLAFCALLTPVQAQQPTKALIVTTCGAQALSANTYGIVTMDVKGNLCNAGSGSGPAQSVNLNGTAYTMLSPDQHNLAITSATSLTPPAGATIAWVSAKTAPVNYTLDGTTTPTASVGTTLAVGGSVILYGPSPIANFKAISATGTLDASYGK